MPKSLMLTFVAVGQQGLLAELLGDPEETSVEVGCRQGVLREEGGQAQQAGGLPQTLKVFGILRQPCAEHCAHRPAELRGEISHLRPRIFWFPGFWGKSLIDSYIQTLYRFNTDHAFCTFHLQVAQRLISGCMSALIMKHFRLIFCLLSGTCASVAPFRLSYLGCCKLPQVNKQAVADKNWFLALRFVFVQRILKVVQSSHSQGVHPEETGMKKITYFFKTGHTNTITYTQTLKHTDTELRSWKTHLLKDCLMWLLSFSPGGFSNLFTETKSTWSKETITKSKLPAWVSALSKAVRHFSYFKRAS